MTDFDQKRQKTPTEIVIYGRKHQQPDNCFTTNNILCEKVRCHYALEPFS